MTLRTLFVAMLATLVSVSVIARLQPPPPPPTPPASQTPPPRQPSEVELSIVGEPGAPPRYAVPDFIALTNDDQTRAAAKSIGQILWDDLAFEREFYMIQRDTYTSIPAASSPQSVAFDRWRELGADALVVGTVQRVNDTFRVQAWLYNVKLQKSVFGKEYSGDTKNERIFAHTISDEIHMQQRALAGVARTRLAFSSDRDLEKMTGPIQKRDVKEIYISDYDGANQRRVTIQRQLNITPAWSPDGRAIAYTSYRGDSPDIAVSFIYKAAAPARPANGKGHNFVPAWSPDGSKIAFWSNRDGNPEIYVMNADGSNPRQLTHHRASDASPTWSPSGNQIAFTSDRTGTPQIFVMDADGLNVRQITHASYCDRPTWSPAPYNEIAYASRTGPGYDIVVYDIATGQHRQITFGEGSNESPTFAANGRHLAFMSTRSGKSHIFTIGRDGKGLKQITRVGNNYMPNWSR
ncbi:MAG: Tol-Pal system beta propeller repeat protein TolB [Acidobacteria bacterium]|nr:Tol-Pal system beta propeller repeat protein TolB [Acidobacteriota bacterium]